MSIDTLRSILGWCVLINYGVLCLWFGAFMLGRRGWLRRLHGHWFHLGDGVFDALHYGGMAFYKVLVLVFNLVPWLVLSLLRG